MMRDYPSRGGKGIRGSFCLLWCDLFGGNRGDALNTATALELFQNWILIHDDIEDESDLRRGQPALHKKYGTPLSINAGDALHGKMWELLTTNQSMIGSDLTLSILSEFCLMLNGTTEGQHMELSWTLGSKWDISESDYLLMVTKKAAWYTCISPSRMGVILSTAENKRNDLMEGGLLGRLVDVGTNLGIAFQIVDDILNLTASEEKYGKEILGDLFEGKRTLMLIHLLENCGESKRGKIISTLSKHREEKRTSEVQEIFKLMETTGSVEYGRTVAEKFHSKSITEFDAIAREYGFRNSATFGTTRLLMEYLAKRDY